MRVSVRLDLVSGTIAGAWSGQIDAPNSSANSSWLSTTLACPLADSGQRNRPFSRRLAQTHSPLPSQNRSFRRFLCALANRTHAAQRIAQQPVARQP